MTDVVITGMGATTPLGGTLADTWRAMLAGRRVRHRLHPREWAADLPVRIAGYVKVDPSGIIDRVKARRLDRSAQLALIAAEEAWLDAGYGLGDDRTLDPNRLGVALGSGIGGLHTILGQWDVYKEKGPRRVSPFTIPMLMANAPAANVALMVGAAAAVNTPVSACASSNEAIALAVDQIRLGRADVVVAGGSEATIHPLPLAAFAQMQALSRRNDDPAGASRPWDRGRDGFVLAEGAAVLVLESLEHALARGAKIYATVAGAGISNDNHDIVQPEPTGTGQAAAMVKALQESGLAASDIKHVNAHGTSTPQGDLTEAVRSAGAGCRDGRRDRPLHQVDDRAPAGRGRRWSRSRPCWRSGSGWSPTINLHDPDDGLDIDIAANQSRPLPAGDLAAINNSFGFGGANVAVAFTTANVRE